MLEFSRMICRQKTYRIGDFVPGQNSSAMAYVLPPGMEPGSMCKVIGFDHGSAIVEHGGTEWRISRVYIDTARPLEYQLPSGQWIDQDHPAVIAARKQANTPQETSLPAAANLD